MWQVPTGQAGNTTLVPLGVWHSGPKAVVIFTTSAVFDIEVNGLRRPSSPQGARADLQLRRLRKVGVLCCTRMGASVHCRELSSAVPRQLSFVILETAFGALGGCSAAPCSPVQAALLPTHHCGGPPGVGCQLVESRQGKGANCLDRAGSPISPLYSIRFETDAVRWPVLDGSQGGPLCADALSLVHLTLGFCLEAFLPHLQAEAREAHCFELSKNAFVEGRSPVRRALRAFVQVPVKSSVWSRCREQTRFPDPDLMVIRMTSSWDEEWPGRPNGFGVSPCWSRPTRTTQQLGVRLNEYVRLTPHYHDMPPHPYLLLNIQHFF